MQIVAWYFLVFTVVWLVIYFPLRKRLSIVKLVILDLVVSVPLSILLPFLFLALVLGGGGR